MANRFEITVVGVDEFSKTFEKLNSGIEKSGIQPLERVTKKTDSFLKTLDKGFAGASRGAQQLASSLGSAAAPLESLVGLGAGGLSVAGGVGAVAGIAGITNSFMQTGWGIATASNAIGTGAEQLQRWVAAAKRFNLDGGIMQSTIAAIARDLRDAQFDPNSPAAMIFSKLGFDMARIKSGGYGVDETIRRIADALHEIQNPQTRLTLAQALGFDPASIVALKEGSAALDKAADAAQRAGQIMTPEQLRQSQEGVAAINAMSGALTGLEYRLAAMSAPRVTSSVNWLSDLFAGNWARVGAGVMSHSALGLAADLHKPTPHPWTHAEGRVMDESEALHPLGGGSDADAAAQVHQWAEGLRPRNARGEAAKQAYLDGRVDVVVHAPDGQRVTASSSSPSVSVRIAGSMPTVSTP